MKKGTPVLLMLLLSNLVMFLLAPRFGWELSDGSDVPYRYAGQRRSGGYETDTYEKAGNTLSIVYSSGLSRAFEIRLNDAPPFPLHVELDGGIRGLPANETGSVLDWLTSDIVWKDSRGLFLYRLLLPAAAVLLYLFCFLRAQRVESKRARALFLALSACLFLLASVMLLRVIF